MKTSPPSSYAVIAGSPQSLCVELYRDGATTWQGEVSVTETAASLQELVSQQSGGKAAWAEADGAKVKNAGSNLIYFNNSASECGALRGTPLDPTSSCIGTWSPDQVAFLGMAS